MYPGLRGPWAGSCLFDTVFHAFDCEPCLAFTCARKHISRDAQTALKLSQRARQPAAPLARNPTLRTAPNLLPRATPIGVSSAHIASSAASRMYLQAGDPAPSWCPVVERPSARVFPALRKHREWTLQSCRSESGLWLVSGCTVRSVAIVERRFYLRRC